LAKNNKIFIYVIISIWVIVGIVALILLRGTPEESPNLSQANQSQKNTNTGSSVEADWENVGEIQGEMQTLVFDSSDGNIAYLSTDGQGIYRSHDGGLNWELLGPSGKTFLDLSIDVKSGRIYASEIRDGVVFSDDNGVSWEISSLQRGEAHVAQVDPRDPKVVWAGYWLRGNTGPSLYLSKDGGKSWVPTVGGPQGKEIDFVKFDEESKDTYVGTYSGGLFKTTDDGESWKSLNSGLNTNTDITIMKWTKDKSVFYVGTHDFGTFRSTDKGQSWQPINTGKESATDVHGLVVDPNDPKTVYVAGMMMGKGIFKSTDMGDTWKPIQAEGVNLDDVHVFELNPEQTHIYLGSGEHGEGKGILYRLKI